MLSQLIYRHQNYFQLALAVFGSLCGLVILLASLQAYLDFKNLLTEKTGIINPQFVIVNKKVSLLNTLAFSHNSFSKEEIEKFKQVKTVERIGAFESNLFTAQAYIEENANRKIPGFYTELFFESVPDEFIDVKSERWKWTPGDSTVPIIIPADYLNLYNFGFAPSQNLPQISKKTVETATFRVKIRGTDSTAFFNARIAGFSDRINSFLVPQNFLEEANKTFGSGKTKNPSRLILVSADPSSPALMKFLDDNGYETNAENLKAGKLNLVMRIIMNILAGIGGVIILLSLLGFIQYSQLMLSRSRYEIQTLIQLGYYHLAISKKYMLFFVLLFSFVLAASFGLLLFLKGRFVALMLENGFEIDGTISSAVILTATGIFIFLVIVNSISVYRNVRALAKPA